MSHSIEKLLDGIPWLKEGVLWIVDTQDSWIRYGESVINAGC